MKVLLCIAVLATLALADRVVFERKLHQVPGEFHHLKRAAPHKPARFYLALPQRNIDVLHEKLMDMSNPNSPNYAQWMTMQEVTDLVSTSPEVVDRVTSWLYSNDINEEIQEISFTGDSLKVVANVAFTERLFGVRMHYFFHPKQGLMMKAIGAIALPEEIADSIELIAEITEFPPAAIEPKSYPAVTPDAPTGPRCNGPPTMKAIYNITDSTPNGPVTQAAFSNYSPDGIGNDDLLAWFTQTSSTSNPITGRGPGTFIDKYTDDEGILDIDLLTTLAENATTYLWINPGPGQSVWMYTYTQELVNSTNPPTVNSISYGWEEADQCSIGDDCDEFHIAGAAEYIARTENEFMKLTATGLSFFAASGDCGVNGVHCEYQCQNGDFNPIYPGSSAYITVVGSTIAVPGELPPLDDSTWNTIPLCSDASSNCNCNTGAYQLPTQLGNYGGFNSGGGFSNFNARPSWQDAAVENYFSANVTLPPSSAYNASGRAYPDLAALGGNIATWPGSLSLSGGTSAASPSAAAIFTLLNAELVKAGYSTLGFLNTMLYQAINDCPQCFFDVTIGNNFDCPTSHGFECTEGWDPVSGLGSVNYGNMKEYVFKMQEAARQKRQ